MTGKFAEIPSGNKWNKTRDWKIDSFIKGIYNVYRMIDTNIYIFSYLWIDRKQNLLLDTD